MLGELKPKGPYTGSVQLTGRHNQDLGRASGVNRGTHTQLIAYHTIGVWGAGSDDVGLMQSTKAPKHQDCILKRA
jgi:hypothetical protein